MWRPRSLPSVSHRRLVGLVVLAVLAGSLQLPLALLFAPTPAMAATVTINPTDNIFGAGLICGTTTDCPHPGNDCGPGTTHCPATNRKGGTAPQQLSIPGGTTYVTWKSRQLAGDQIGESALPSNPSQPVRMFPGPSAGYTAVNPVGGISGLVTGVGSMLLAGVFLGASQPPTAPPSLYYDSVISRAQAEAPQLGQTFFMGAGDVTGTGVLRQFVVPTGALYLYMGWVDANESVVSGNVNVVGDAGWYADNLNYGSGPDDGTVTFNTAPVTAPVTVRERLSPSELRSFVHCACDPIDTLSGGFALPAKDIDIPDRGPNLTIDRLYNALNAGTAGGFGDGWAFNYGMKLANNTPVTDSVTITEETGSTIIFSKNSTGAYLPENPRIRASLSYDAANSIWSFIRTRSQFYTFDVNGRLTKIKDLNGASTGLGENITYPSASQMVATDLGGRPLTFTIDPAHNNRITAAVDPVGRTVTYAYDSTFTYLTSVVDVRGQTTKYCYNQNPATAGCPAYDAAQPVGLLRRFIDPRGNNVTNVYDTSRRVTTQTDRAGKTSTLSYGATDPACGIGGTVTTQITSPAGSDGNPDVTLDSYLAGQLVCQTKSGVGTVASTWKYTYDPITAGVRTATDPRGKVTTTYRDGFGNVTQLIDPLGRQTLATYNKYNQPLTMTDANQVTSTYTYDPTRPWQLTAKATPLTGTTSVATTKYVYDTTNNAHFGDLVQIQDPDQSGQPTPKATVLTHDDGVGGDAGNVIAAANPAGETTTFTYDRLSRRTTTVTPNGNNGGPPDNTYRSVAVYDQALPVASVNELGAGIGDSFGRAPSATALGSTDTGEGWTATVGTWGVTGGQAYLASGTNAIATIPARTDGILVFQMPAAQTGVGVVFRYKDANNYWKLTADTGAATWTLTEIKAGAVAQTKNGGVCCNPFDIIDVLFGGTTINVGVNGVGHIIDLTDTDFGTYPTVGLFAAAPGAGRIAALWVTNGVGGASAAIHDADANPTTTVDANGQITKQAFDADNRPTVTTRPDATTTATTYWDNGLVKDQVDGNAKNTTYTYDHVGRVRTAVDPAVRAVGYSYDLAGNLTKVKTPDHATDVDPAATLTYDDANQVTQVQYGSFNGAPGCAVAYCADAASPDITATYDSLGRRTSMADGTGLSCYGWDSLNRMKAYVTNAATCATPGTSAVTTTYGYDNLRGLLSDITYPGQTTPVHRTFDDASRMTSVTDWLTNKTWFKYDKNSNLTCSAVAATNPCPGGTPTLEVSYKFNAANQMVDVGATKAITVTSGATTDATYSYARDALGQAKTNATTVAGTTTQNETYSYSALNQLQGVNYPTTYSYDTADNPTGLIFGSILTYDPAHAGNANQPYQMKNASTGAVQRTYSYDQEGRRTQDAIAGGSTTNLTWNKANRLTNVSALANYTYNGDGLRTQTNVWTFITNMQWDPSGSIPLLLRSGSNTNWDNYIYGPDNKPIERINTNGATNTVNYITHDQQGSTRLLLDTTGTVIGTYNYEPYGRVSAHPAGANIQLQYNGEWTDDETGFQYLRSRFYDPLTAQFLSRDPLTGMTRAPYGYAGSSPLTFSDPLGQSPQDALNSVEQWSYNVTPYIHNISVDIGGLATLCSIVTAGALVPCDIVALTAAASTAITGTGLYSEGRETQQQAYLDSVGALFSGLGTAASGSVAGLKGLSGAANDQASALRLQRQSAGWWQLLTKAGLYLGEKGALFRSALWGLAARALQGMGIGFNVASLGTDAAGLSCGPS